MHFVALPLQLHGLFVFSVSRVEYCAHSVSVHKNDKRKLHRSIARGYDQFADDVRIRDRFRASPCLFCVKSREPD